MSYFSEFFLFFQRALDFKPPVITVSPERSVMTTVHRTEERTDLLREKGRELWRPAENLTENGSAPA